jgi:septum formation protein
MLPGSYHGRVNDSARGPLILASASPRRRALLETAGFDVLVRVPHADEAWPAGERPEVGAVTLARRKLSSLGEVDGLALAADTVVVIGGELLGKPANATQARQMLTRLSGQRHEVTTGFVLRRATRSHAAAVTTAVWFRPLGREEIERYLTSPEAYDKAGAYGIQGTAGAFVDRVEGSYTNVVGLPLGEVLLAVERLS